MVSGQLFHHFFIFKINVLFGKTLNCLSGKKFKTQFEKLHRKLHWARGDLNIRLNPDRQHSSHIHINVYWTDFYLDTIICKSVFNLSYLQGVQRLPNFCRWPLQGLYSLKCCWPMTHSLPYNGRFLYLTETLRLSQYNGQQGHPEWEVKIRDIYNIWSKCKEKLEFSQNLGKIF